MSKDFSKKQKNVIIREALIAFKKEVLRATEESLDRTIADFPEDEVTKARMDEDILKGAVNYAVDDLEDPFSRDAPYSPTAFLIGSVTEGQQDFDDEESPEEMLLRWAEHND